MNVTWPSHIATSKPPGSRFHEHGAVVIQKRVGRHGNRAVVRLGIHITLRNMMHENELIAAHVAVGPTVLAQCASSRNRNVLSFRR